MKFFPSCFAFYEQIQIHPDANDVLKQDFAVYTRQWLASIGKLNKGPRYWLQNDFHPSMQLKMELMTTKTTDSD